MAEQERVAYLGLGTMGLGMVRNLVAHGHEVTVWNRTPRDLGELGTAVSQAGTIAEAVSGADVVMYCLADDAAVADVVLSEAGAAAAMRPGAVAVDMSTISLEAHEAERAALEARGIALVDAPVFGSKGEAAAGGLWVVAGGSNPDVARVMPMLEAVSESVHHMGAPGSGVRMKLVGNLVVLSQLTVLGSALSLAAKSGLESEKVLAVLHVTDFKSPIFDGVGSAVISGDYSPSFAASLALKDARLIDAFARELGVEVPPVDTAIPLLEDAVARGWGGENASALIKVIANRAGVALGSDG